MASNTTKHGSTGVVHIATQQLQAKIFLLLDVLPENLCLPGFVVNMPGGADGFYHYPSSLHKRGGVVSFADGHVEAHRWTDCADAAHRARRRHRGALESFREQC